MRSNIKNRFISSVCVLVFLFIFVSPLKAEGANAKEISALADSVLNYTAASYGEKSIQSLINGALTENAGTLSEWYILALVQYDKGYDFTAYRKALEKYIAQNDVKNAVTREKYALLLAATGYHGDYITETVKTSTGSLGLMSYVFSLHLINNGYTSKGYSMSSVAEKILNLQLSDGGWAVSGEKGDVDATAMALQALAPNTGNAKIKKAVHAGTKFLASRLSDTCRYSSYSVENSESISQVIIALSSLGIDPCRDSRFIKNGVTLIDSLKDFRLSDGSFSHTAKLQTNLNATVQALCAFVSYVRLLDGKGPFYILGKTPQTPEATKTEGKTEPKTEKATTVKSTTDKPPTENKTQKHTEKVTDSQKVTKPGGEKAPVHTAEEITDKKTGESVKEKTTASADRKAEDASSDSTTKAVTEALKSEQVSTPTAPAEEADGQNISPSDSGNKTVYIVFAAVSAALLCAGIGIYAAKRKKKS